MPRFFIDGLHWITIQDAREKLGHKTDQQVHQDIDTYGMLTMRDDSPTVYPGRRRIFVLEEDVLLLIENRAKIAALRRLRPKQTALP